MFQLQGCISEVEFGHTAEIGGYADRSLDIPKLGDIAISVSCIRDAESTLILIGCENWFEKEFR